VDYVSPGYLEALGARLVAGRGFTSADDRPDGPRVAIVNETTARRFFPGARAAGETLVIAGEPWTVVGIVRDVAGRTLGAPQSLFAWCPQSFATVGSSSVAVRTRLRPASLLAAVQREVQRLDAGVALANARTLDDAMASSTSPRKILAGLVGAFAAVALTLVTIGLYGLLAYSVATRRREIGIRLAMGASPADLVRGIVRQTLRLTGAGLLVGLVASVGAARLLASQLFDVRPGDLRVVAGTVIVIAAVAAMAAFLPARRAARLDPVAALRAD
jgi:hypothetical protein